MEVKIYDPNDPEQRVAMHARNERWEWWSGVGVLAFVLLVAAMFVTIDLVGNQWWYGDWRCAFVNCVRVQDVKAVPK